MLFGTGRRRPRQDRGRRRGGGAAQSRTSRFDGRGRTARRRPMSRRCSTAPTSCSTARDNFATRLTVSDHCTAARIPLVSAAIGQFQAQIGTFRGWEPDKPCYRCFVGDAFDADDCDTCAELGVLGAMAGHRRQLRRAGGDPRDHRLRRGPGRQAPPLRRARRRQCARSGSSRTRPAGAAASRRRSAQSLVEEARSSRRAGSAKEKPRPATRLNSRNCQLSIRPISEGPRCGRRGAAGTKWTGAGLAQHSSSAGRPRISSLLRREFLGRERALLVEAGQPLERGQPVVDGMVVGRGRRGARLGRRPAAAARARAAAARAASGGPAS